MTTNTHTISYRVTEKAARLGANNTYVFNVGTDVSKTELKKQLEKEYKVTIEGIRIVNTPAKQVFVRGRWGSKSAYKKAYITLKKGDSIVLS
jgi:ribosomal protein L23